MKKGFTLIELLVVIAILAVLATAVVLVLNPAELIKQGRDSTRLSDLAAINNALVYYLADVQSPDLDSGLSVCGTVASGASTVVYCTNTGASPMSAVSCTLNDTRVVSGTGWVPVNLTALSTGSPLAQLPIDPVNGATNYYAYGCNNADLVWEMDANMESTKFVTKETGDGGNNANWYEVGNDPGLNL